MKAKIIIITGCLLAIGIISIFGVFQIKTFSSDSTKIDSLTPQKPSSVATPTSQGETSADIGALFDKSDVQLKYVSFAPLVTRDEAIAIAKNRLQAGFNWDTDKLQADATIALFSGHAFLTDSRAAGNVNDIPAWIVVVKNVPFVGSGGPPPLTQNNTVSQAQPRSQYNLAIDAMTGEILNGVITSMPGY
jgi:hypothetical protein